MPEPDVQEQLADLLRRVKALEDQRGIQDDLDGALLARADMAIEIGSRLERSQLRGFEVLMRNIQELKVEQKQMAEVLDVVVDAVKDHKVHIEGLATQVQGLTTKIDIVVTGQQQLLELMRGHTPLND